MAQETTTQSMTTYGPEAKGMVSILMNCFNGEKYLRPAIDSVFAQTYQNWEIIFWDNASTDQSAAIVKEYQQQPKGDRIKYFRGETTIPLYAARNCALKKTGGEFVAFLDVDDLWFPQKLEKQVPLFKDPEVGLVFSDTIFFDDQGDISRYFENRTYSTGYCFKELFDNYFLSLETVVMRKSCLNKLTHAFDDRFNMIGEADLFRRLAYYYKLDIVPEVLAKWRIHPQSLSHTKAENFAFETELVIEEYKKVIPEFETKYKSEMNELRRQAAIGKARYFLRAGQRAEAMRSLDLSIANKKIWILFAMSLFPSLMTQRLARKYL